ncbi:MAG TPA: hypothetical protein PLU50_04660, partial [Pseudobdellovibrionaceae bacterium]|nr:hypothetical protein [Pseudobdellovibrionaceae bacterium]
MKTKSKLSHDQKRNSVVVRALQTVARPNQWNKNALVLGLVAALGTGYFLHSTSDQVVKISMSQRLGRAAEKP